MSNPFKQKGSYIGAIAGPLLVYIAFKLTYHGCIGIWCFPGMAEKGAAALALVSAVIGFLAGWLIESRLK
jgi:succinate dehydrogenase/fumarate reductase cytochrome b subunit